MVAVVVLTRVVVAVFVTPPPVLEVDRLPRSRFTRPPSFDGKS